MTFDALAARALDTTTKHGASYADIRFDDGRTERAEVRNGDVVTLTDSRSCGYGIRAFVDGTWGFAASARLDDAGVDETAALAVAIAKAGAAIAKHRFAIAPTERYIDTFRTPVVRDPASVSLGERVALLLDVEGALHATSSVRVGRAWIDLWQTEKVFYSTTGSRIAQTIVQTGSGCSALAVNDDDAQDRSYPGDVGLYQSGGW